MHNEVKAKLFEGMTDNLDRDLDEGKGDKSLTLNFEKENMPQKNNPADAQWKDVSIKKSNKFNIE